MVRKCIEDDVCKPGAHMCEQNTRLGLGPCLETGSVNYVSNSCKQGNAWGAWVLLESGSVKFDAAGGARQAMPQAAGGVQYLQAE